MSATIYRFRLRLRLRIGLAGSTAGDPSIGSLRSAADQEMVELRFARTDRGEAEVRRSVSNLPKPVRELLLVMDRLVAVDECVAEVHDTQLADAMLLLNTGLIRTTSAGGNASSLIVLPLIDALLSLPSDDLYVLLTQQAKRRLGLLQGFRMVLALERCNGHHERCAMAVRFVQEIWRTQGEAGIQPLRRLLKA